MNKYDETFQKLLEDGTIYIPPKDAIFDFVDAVLDRQIKRAFNLYEHCKGVNESSFALMSVLFNNAKAVLQVQTCKTKDVAKSTGLTGWQITNAKKHTGKYTDRQLANMLKLINNVTHAVKTGKIEEQFVIDYILVRVL